MIHSLVTRIQDYLYFPQPDPLYVVLGSVAGNMMKGSSIWLMLIGAPSSGRTVLLETLANMHPPKDTKGNIIIGKPGIKLVGAIKSPGALLSGVSKKETTASATGGLLREMGSRGIIVMKDFTSMLSLPKDALHEGIGALREIFDGRYGRPIGSDGGRNLEWRGRLGFIGASTPAIDAKSQMIGELGERWLYYRYPASDGYGETIKSLRMHADYEAAMEDMRSLVENFFDALDIQWDEERREFDQDEMNRLYAIASLVCTARSPVPRTWDGKEVSDVAHQEGPARIAKELGQLYLGLERVGLDKPEDRWRLVSKVALDSVRELRMNVLLALYNAINPIKLTDMKGMFKCGQRTMDALVEDLVIHGLVEWTEKAINRMGEANSNAGVVLTDWARRQIDLAFPKLGEVERVETD